MNQQENPMTVDRALALLRDIAIIVFVVLWAIHVF
jgi:hypothetical protein